MAAKFLHMSFGLNNFGDNPLHTLNLCDVMPHK